MIDIESLRPWIAGVVVTMCTVVGIFDPSADLSDLHQRSQVQRQDFVHLPGFAVITTALLFGLSASPGASSSLGLLRILLIFVAAVMIGGVIELAQGMVGGDADPWDVVRDAGGAVIALLIATSMWCGLPTSARWVFRSAALATAIFFFIPTLTAFADEARARRQFPVLAEFGTAAELERFAWGPRSQAYWERTDGPDGGRGVLHLALKPGRYPGLSFLFFPRDWRGWRELVIICTSLDDRPFPLTVRVDDIKHNQDYNDRYNRTFVLAPGRNELHIPLVDVELAPRGRKLDLAQVNSVILFAADLRESRELLFQELRLSR